MGRRERLVLGRRGGSFFFFFFSNDDFDVFYWVGYSA